MKLTEDLKRYNTLVKDKYKLDANGFNWVVAEVLDTPEYDADIPYYEIPSYETKSGRAETYELWEEEVLK